MNKDTGFFSAPISNFKSKFTPHLYRTKDGGNTWEFIDSFADIVYFHYFDFNHAIFSAYDRINIKDTGRKNIRCGLWYSKDGGKTRDSIPGTTNLGVPMFLTKSTGFSFWVGCSLNAEITPGAIFKTSDGGMHWHKVLGNYKNNNYYNFIKPRKLWFPSDSITGYTQSWNMTFDSTILYKTIDGGDSWSIIYRSKNPNANFVYSEKFIFITKDLLLHSWDTAALISRDGGKSWNSTYFPRPYGLSNFVFTDTLTVYGSTKGYLAKDSTGTGFYWGLSDYSDSIFTPDIYFIGINFAYAYTPDRNASLIYTLQNPQKWSGVITAVKESIFHDEALEIFPNPASGWVNLKGYGFKPGKAELFCRDMLGRTVYNIKMQAGNDGTFQCTIDISKLRQGMYQVEVWQGNFKQEKKLMVR